MQPITVGLIDGGVDNVSVEWFANHLNRLKDVGGVFRFQTMGVLDVDVEVDSTDVPKQHY